MRTALQLAAAVIAMTAGTRSEAADLIAIKPGLMCVSAEALARLIQPNGDSRTHRPAPTLEDVSLAAAGSCIDIPEGARVSVRQAFKNTSIVIYDGPGAPADGMLIVPNIDFRPIVEPRAQSSSR